MRPQPGDDLTTASPKAMPPGGWTYLYVEEVRRHMAAFREEGLTRAQAALEAEKRLRAKTLAMPEVNHMGLLAALEAVDEELGRGVRELRRRAQGQSASSLAVLARRAATLTPQRRSAPRTRGHSFRRTVQRSSSGDSSSGGLGGDGPGGCREVGRHHLRSQRLANGGAS